MHVCVCVYTCIMYVDIYACWHLCMYLHMLCMYLSMYVYIYNNMLMTICIFINNIFKNNIEKKGMRVNQ